MHTQKFQYLRIAAEGGAILVSILLAFAIESWSDQGDLRDREQEILRSLLVDFDSSRERIIANLRFHEATRALNLDLLQSAITETPIPDIILNQYLADLSWVDANSHIATGALNSVLSGGELTTIRNNELRKLIADWPLQIETINTIRQQGNTFYGEKWLPYFATHGYLPQLIAIDSPMPGNPASISKGEKLGLAEPYSHTALLRDNAFHNLLAMKNWVILDYILIYQVALEKLNQSIQLLEQEIR